MSITRELIDLQYSFMDLINRVMERLEDVEQKMDVYAGLLYERGLLPLEQNNGEPDAESESSGGGDPGGGSGDLVVLKVKDSK
jgi:hypothetical protein